MTVIGTWPAKDPSDVLDYKIEWSAIIGTDTITSSTWAVPTGITVNSDAYDDTSSTIWLSGGTAGVGYRLANTVVTSAGRTFERSVDLPVMNL